MTAKQHDKAARRIRVEAGNNIVDDLYCATVRAYDKARDLDADPAAIEMLEDVLETLHAFRR
jgi:hypothetical protein